ncbi:MAG: Hsp20/alpha crystallin family protein [Candidatus Bathyarchaeota archaeon]|nr:MAG: Hsp20/alpha crystallin family protein [Candidatus Bathyarchaeota archaeon]
MSIRKRRSILDLINEYIEEMESLAEKLLPTERPSWNINTHTIEPLCEVSVTRSEVVVTADLPFSDPDSIKIDPLDKRTIEISARINRRICCEDLGIQRQKGEFSTFSCHVEIPVPVDISKIEKRLKKGFLEIRIPRKRGFEIEVT